MAENDRADEFFLKEKILNLKKSLKNVFLAILKHLL